MIDEVEMESRTGANKVVVVVVENYSFSHDVGQTSMVVIGIINRCGSIVAQREG